MSLKIKLKVFVIMYPKYARLNYILSFLFNFALKNVSLILRFRNRCYFKLHYIGQYIRDKE